MSARPEWLAPSRRDGPVGPASRALGQLWAHRAQHARTQYVSSAVHLSTVIAGRENLSPRVWLDPIRGHLENAQRREAVNEIRDTNFLSHRAVVPFSSDTDMRDFLAFGGNANR